jgi:hypothetical protein
MAGSVTEIVDAESINWNSRYSADGRINGRINGRMQNRAPLTAAAMQNDPPAEAARHHVVRQRFVGKPPTITIAARAGR